METIKNLINVIVDTSLFLLIVITIAVGMTVNSKKLKRDSISFLIVLTFLLLLSR